MLAAGGLGGDDFIMNSRALAEHEALMWFMFEMQALEKVVRLSVFSGTSENCCSGNWGWCGQSPVVELCALDLPQMFWSWACHCCCSVAKLCLTLWDPMDCSMPGFPVLHCLPELAQTLVHWVIDAIQPSYLLLLPFLPAFNLPQHRDLFQWVSSSHPVAKILELQLQHQSFQWIFRVDFL